MSTIPKQRYRVVTATTKWGIEREVNKLIDQGFVPTGGTARSMFGMYTQAVFYPMAIKNGQWTV